MIEPFLLPVSHLKVHEQEEMFILLQKHFLGVTWHGFLADLREKNWVILLRLNGVLTGFSTILFYQTRLEQEEVCVVYSGDTITDPSMWSSPALAQAWIKGLSALHQAYQRPLYWLLISSGYRTYRFLSIFCRVFYPHYDRPTPQPWQKKMNLLASQKFPSYYDPASGIIRFPHPQVLSPELRFIPPEKLNDPHVAFFVQQNPGHERGDELVCLAEVAESNATRAGMRIWKTGSPLHIPYPIEAEVLYQQ